MLNKGRLMRRTFFGALGALFLAPAAGRSQANDKTFKLTVKDGGTQLNDPMQYLELHFQDDTSKIVIMGPPKAPFIDYLIRAQQQSYEVTFNASSEFPSS